MKTSKDSKPTPKAGARRKRVSKDSTPAPPPESGAAASPEPRPTAQPGQYLSFLLGGEEYAAGILQLREIIEFDVLTKVPMMPPWVRGVLNLRGNVVPVVDVALKFGLPETAVTHLTCVVIVEVELDEVSTVMGMMVDEVSQVLELGADQIEPPPAFGTRIHGDYLLGMGIHEEKFILILDIGRVLAVDELMDVASIALDGAAQESPAEQPDAPEA